MDETVQIGEGGAMTLPASDWEQEANLMIDGVGRDAVRASGEVAAFGRSLSCLRPVVPWS